MSFELCHEEDKSAFHTIESFFRQMRGLYMVKNYFIRSLGDKYAEFTFNPAINIYFS